MEGSDASYSGFTVRDGILFHKGKMYLGESSALKSHVLREFHEMPVGGHAGVARTFGPDVQLIYGKGVR